MRPRLALAMTEALADVAFDDTHWSRLETVAEVLDRRPLTTFDDERARSLLAEADILLGHWGCPTLDEAALVGAPKLRLFAYAAGSVKERRTVTDAVFDHGIVVTSAAAANAVPVAEFTLAVILLANKGAFVTREWFRDPDGVSARRPRPLGNYGKVAGLVGASHVGRAVIDLLRPFRIDVLVSDPYLDASEAARLGVDSVELDDLLERSDVVSLHAPDLPSTARMIDAAALARLKDGAVLVNTARGRLVDTEALEAELATGRISAVLDVTEPEPLPRTSPLYTLPNVFLTPHIAGSQGNELGRLADLAVTEIERFAAGDDPLHPVRRTDLDRIA